MHFLFFLLLNVVNSFFDRLCVSTQARSTAPGSTSQYLQQHEKKATGDCAVTQYQRASHTHGISNLGPRDNEELSQFARLIASSFSSRSVSGTLISRSSEENSPTVSLAQR